ncbi:MAG TPA: aminotransferase class I/II-fold pyridoxal phosphate-dependent enzyme, partial [Phaeodactylibacter sp.]|nr:aminotransferase class I/II-fold pyridoxal phosphate-dependent enzyme [Phaeodactylibacter sp.]
KLITRNTRMLIINTPHNPCGRVLSREDMLELRRLATEYELLVLSDEVYEHILFDGLQHHSAMSFPELYAHSLVVFSFGKVFHNTGWKMGYCVAPPALTERFRQVHQFNVFSANRPIQHALADYLRQAEGYEYLPDFFQDLRDTLTQQLSDTPLQPLPCEGTYFMLCDYSQISDKDDMAFAKWLTIEHGLATIPLSPFYTRPPKENRLIRLCFAKTKDLLEKAGNIAKNLQ